jgi:hypothetical protein
MGQLFNTLIEFFEEDDWNFQWVEGETVLSMGFAGKNGRWMCYAQAREPQEQFVFYSICPVNVPENRRVAAAEYLTRANYGMIVGNFEMDYDDGEIRYKTSIDIEGATLLPPLIKSMVYTNLLMLDRYLPGLMAVVYGGASPAEQIKEIESGARSAPDELSDEDRLADDEDNTPDPPPAAED